MKKAERLCIYRVSFQRKAQVEREAEIRVLSDVMDCSRAVIHLQPELEEEEIFRASSS